MAKSRKFTVRFRRKGEFKTDYKRRFKLIKSGLPRLVIRPTLKNIILQMVEYHEKGDKILVGVNSRSLKKLGWKYNLGNITSAYLTGLLLGKKAIKKNIKKAILDIGLRRSVKGSRIYASLKGVADAGVNIEYNKSILPDEDKIKGKNIKIDEKEFNKIKEKIENG